MLRYRRYRVFLLFTGLTIFLLWRFSSPTRWEQSAHAVDSFTQQLGLREGRPGAAAQQEEHAHAKESTTSPYSPLADDTFTKGPEKVPLPAIADIPKPVQEPPPLSPHNPQAPQLKPDLASKPSNGQIPGKGVVGQQPTRVEPGDPPAPPRAGQLIAEAGVSRKMDDPLPPNALPIRWSKQDEHFPVTSTIQLPQGSPKPLPKIQAVFEAESERARTDRLEKLAVIKEAFMHAWKGYKTHAWAKDELKPVSGGFKNPFNGWGATLIDSLDTIWMMGLKDEFEEAVAAVAEVDFKTSRRADIPVFETVIRFLGGLIGAYDVSGGKYKILLDKAVELAEVLMGAFDTPNRMPITFYQWKPTFASQPHRAGNRVVLAELGSLSVEFTRLAQITKEPKYYDAIARITDALQEWQDHTSIPGLWPIYVDAAGCERVKFNAAGIPSSGSSGKGENKMIPLEKPPPLVFKAVEMEPSESQASKSQEGSGDDARVRDENQPRDQSIPDDTADGLHLVKAPRAVLEADSSQTGPKVKRQLEDTVVPPEAQGAEAGTAAIRIPESFGVPSSMTLPECAPHGLDSYIHLGTEHFTLGSMADSTYEYLPKEYVLLGGLKEQYRDMYTYAADVAAQKLFFRVMIPDEKRELLVAGMYAYPSTGDEDAVIPDEKNLGTGGSHLSCFVGGMYALGAKLFDRPKDLELAQKVTDACVWAYESTATGIMPETFSAVACRDRTHCPWNETKWWEELDPNAEWRQQNYERQMHVYMEQVAARASASKAAAELAAQTATAVANEEESISDQTSPPKAATDERELTEENDDGRSLSHHLRRGTTPTTAALDERDIEDEAKLEKRHGQDMQAVHGNLAKTGLLPPSQLLTSTAPIWKPEPPLSHEEYVTDLLSRRPVPPGMLPIGDARYILRPEALESVFYMHRITGAPYWREAGWRMISAILNYTRTEIGHSGVQNVHKAADAGGWNDSMESFWLAETLKYAWLLFCDESEWSLDEWVLNTEAHPLRRPDAGPWDGGM